jgi:LasA protease
MNTIGHRIPFHPKYIFLFIGVVFIVLIACARMVAPASAPFSVSSVGTPFPTEAVVNAPALSNTRAPGSPILTPTPDKPHTLPTPRTEPEKYTVKSGDTMGKIAQSFGISLESLIKANPLPNPDYLEVGQVLTIPAPTAGGGGSSFKIIPDSELVYGPASVSFDIEKFIQKRGGYLAQYSDQVDGQPMSGAQIVQRVSYEYSVNPRLLLALLDYRSGWVTKSNPDENTRLYPMGVMDSYRKGLYYQLAWTADNLNRGYYLWRVGGIGTLSLAGGSLIQMDATINAGTAGLQYLLSLFYSEQDWFQAVGEKGFFATYTGLFGYPFDLAVEPLAPESLVQPKLLLPFEKGVVWSFTGGPHGGWGDGSAWAAIDFAPPGKPLGCVESDEWVVASADGPIVRAANGAVVQDLDTIGPGGAPADGKEQTGWTILYMHIETRDRVQAGTYLHTGDRIGHPSCEGGVSTGTHTHIARRYNGEWIPADQTLPFVLEGWITRGTGREYDGFLEKDGHSVEALEGRSSLNAISH